MGETPKTRKLEDVQSHTITPSLTTSGLVHPIVSEDPSTDSILFPQAIPEIAHPKHLYMRISIYYVYAKGIHNNKCKSHFHIQ